MSTLTRLPAAFLHAAFACDLAGRLLERQPLWVAGHYLGLAGVVTGVAALRYRPARGFGMNLLALVLFALAGWVGGAPEVPPDPVLVGVEGIGAALLLVAGWRGRRAPAAGS